MSNTQVCVTFDVAPVQSRCSAQQGLGSPAGMLWTQVSQSQHEASMAPWFRSGLGLGGMKAACYLENDGLFLPLVASAPGKYHLVIIRTAGIYEGLSLCQAGTQYLGLGAGMAW